jgi:UDP-N-acetylmuramyl pentapeptide phosphotransferase/UDP-N-acetylglucosamine-1-phosphate transferase
MWWLPFLLFALGALGAAWAGTGAVLHLLKKRAILDHPNERSSHATPTPHGAGLALVPVVLVAWSMAAALAGTLTLYGSLFAAALVLAAVSWRDDLRGLGALPRLAVQAAAVAVGMAVLPGPGAVFQGLLPEWLDLVAAGFLWLWFINLFNFMDGIDGLAGTEAACIGAGLYFVTMAGAWPGEVGLYALVIAAAALGFLQWNWHPARIFLGDVGSVPLGYLIGWLLLGAAAHGLWPAALLLPLYYLADATLTLLSRLRRRQVIWRAHRDHYYQQAVRRGLGHDTVVRAVLGVNLVLTVCAVVSLSGGLAAAGALAMGALSVAAVLWYFRGATGGARTDG